MSEKDLKAAFRTIRAAKGAATVSPDELLRFRSGEMEAEEREQLLERAAVSPEVARALLDTRRFPDVDPADERDRLSDEDVSRQWQRFQERLRTAPPSQPGPHEEVPIPAEPPPVESPPSPPPKEPWLWQLFGSPRFAQATAALLLLGLVLSWVLWLPQEQEPRLNLPIVELVPEDERAERTQEEPLKLSADAGGIFVVLALRGHRSYTTYEVEIRDANENPVWSSTEIRRSPEGIFTLGLPRGFLPTGRYRIVLRGGEGDSRETLAVYRLAIGQ